MVSDVDMVRLVSFSDKGADVYRKLREAFLNYDFAPFTQITIRAQADRLGVSSTPIRESLIKILNEGIITFIPGRGFFTKPLTREEVHADLELEVMMLRHSINKVANNALRFDIEPLRTLALNLEAIVDDENQQEKYAVTFGDLHSQIALLSGNQKIHRSMILCCDRLRYVRILDMTCRSRSEFMIDIASNILECLMQRKIIDAIIEVDQQFDAAIKQIDRIVKEGNARSISSSLPTDL